MTATPTPIYEWCGDYFCTGCIVFTICNHEPFSGWAEDGNTIGNNPTALNLQLIREFLTTRNVDLTTVTWPRRLRRPPEGVQICATCLNFFTIPEQEETSE